MIKETVLQNPDIQDLRLQLKETGAPADRIIDEAIDHFTKNMNPGPAVLINLVKGFLVARLKEYGKTKQPTTILGRAWRWIFGI